jgi:hypothetical protein
MLIALLAIIGVDLIVSVVFAIVVSGCRWWVRHHAGAFAGPALVADGDLAEFGTRRRRGDGRWVRDVLVWTPVPRCLRNAIVAVDGVDRVRAAPGKVHRMGADPLVITVITGAARLAMTVNGSDAVLVTAPSTGTSAGPDRLERHEPAVRVGAARSRSI